MQKRLHLKYALYKVSFAVVLCAFFFVQTQAAFMACAYNDFAPVGQHGFLQKGNPGVTVIKAKGISETPPKFKLNKRYQPVASPAILPYSFVQPLSYIVISTGWPIHSCPKIDCYLLCKPLRGPPCI